MAGPPEIAVEESLRAWTTPILGIEITTDGDILSLIGATLDALEQFDTPMGHDFKTTLLSFIRQRGWMSDDGSDDGSERPTSFFPRT